MFYAGSVATDPSQKLLTSKRVCGLYLGRLDVGYELVLSTIAQLFGTVAFTTIEDIDIKLEKLVHFL